jgi:hypothetical protein
MTAEHFVLGFIADSAQEAIDKAKQWVRDEPCLRLLTIVSCRLRDPGRQMWTVDVVVNRVEMGK